MAWVIASNASPTFRLLLSAAMSFAALASPSAFDRLMSAMISLLIASSAFSSSMPRFWMASEAAWTAAALMPCALARESVATSIRWTCAASFTASMVNSFTSRIADWIASASRFPAVAPFTMLIVMPSIPADAPLAALVAACSMLDRPELMLLIEAFALLTSTSTTSSSLLIKFVVQKVNHGSQT
jgi:hypothetical protein